jgi:hypothetical protein
MRSYTALKNRLQIINAQLHMPLFQIDYIFLISDIERYFKKWRMHEILKRMEIDEQAATRDKFFKNKKLVAR